MIKGKDIDNLVEDTLQSLDGLKKANPAPYFHVRLMARMNDGNESIPFKFISSIMQPALIIPVVSVLLVFHIYMIGGYLKKRSPTATEERVQALALEYNNGSGTSFFYERNNENP
jgi:hypothetical protein